MPVNTNTAARLYLGNGESVTLPSGGLPDANSLLRVNADGTSTLLSGADLLAWLFAGAPTTDPGIAGQVWLNNGVVTIAEQAPPSIGTIIYDEQFATDYGTIPNNSAVNANVGQTVFFNVKSGDEISGGELLFDAATTIIVCDNECKVSPRTRLAGRIHYVKAETNATADFAAWYAVGITGSNSGTNWWAQGKHDPGVMFHNAEGDIRDARGYLGNASGSTYNRGNYQWKAYLSGDETVEVALVERGTSGTMGFVRIDGGDWRLVTIESQSSASGGLNSWNSGAAGVANYQRLLTANTEFSPTPIVQHSFGSAISPSDGAGQQEAGGGSVVAETDGSVTIAGNALAMSTEGSGSVIFDTGVTDWVAHCQMTIYDGSPCGPIIRWIDADNYLYAELDSSTDSLKLIEVVSGSPTTLETIALNPGATDTWDVTDGLDLFWTWRSVDGSNLIVSVAPGSAHDSFIDSTTTRFSASTKCGVRLSRGAGVESATAEDFAVFAGVMILPDFAV